MLYMTRNGSLNPANGIDRLFAEMTRGLDLPAPRYDPAFDVAESETAWHVTAELPGLDPKDVEISVIGSVLTVKGEKKAEKSEGESVRKTERRIGKFARSFEFPTELDGAKVEARAKNGVLTIVLPKAEAAKPKSITIRAE
jgi:HSP20 family protein